MATKPVVDGRIMRSRQIVEKEKVWLEGPPPKCQRCDEEAMQPNVVLGRVLCTHCAMYVVEMGVYR